MSDGPTQLVPTEIQLIRADQNLRLLALSHFLLLVGALVAQNSVEAEGGKPSFKLEAAKNTRRGFPVDSTCSPL